jgi:uncharacterized protein (TIGR02186 family)
MGVLPPGDLRAAERLVTSVSTYRVLISSNFTGTDVVLFGSIEDETPAKRDSGYDVVVTVRGPPQSFVAYRKERVLGLWINVDSRQFIDVPSYLAVLASRPPSELGTPEFLRRNRIGIANQTLRQRIGTDFADVVAQDPFRVAFLRVKTGEKLFHEEPQGVTFLTPTLFRATVPIPGTAPTGNYEIETLLIHAGQVVARDATAIEVVKTGLEEVVAQAAREHGFIYGLATALLALASGLLASVLFRRD